MTDEVTPKLITDKIMLPPNTESLSETPISPMTNTQPDPLVQEVESSPSTILVTNVLDKLLEYCQSEGMSVVDKEAHFNAIYNQLGLPSSAQRIATELGNIFSQGVQGNQ